MLLDYIANAVNIYLAWYNAGGVWLNQNQIIEYVNSRMEVWAYSKVN